MREMHTEFDCKPERKRPLRRMGRFMENNINVDFSRGIGCENVDRFYVIQHGKLLRSGYVKSGEFLLHLPPIIIIIIIIITAIDFSLVNSSPYTSTLKTNKNKIYINETIQKHSTNNTKHCKYKYT
jgi:hypothetical protein